MRATHRARAHSGLIFLLAALGTACSKSGGTDATPAPGVAGPPIVHTVNYPLMYFAERIGGDHVDVRFIVPADEDPAFWAPTDAEVSALQAANLILLNGATYAKWRNHVSLPESRLVDTGEAFENSLIEVEVASTHSHGGDGDHSHAGVAFTTWIDMRQARQQAEAVRDALVDLVPHARSDLEANATALFEDIDQLDAAFEAEGARIGAQPLVASHPVYQYFARRYGLDVKAVFWEPDAVPDDAAMTALRTLLSGHAAAWMIWEGEPAAESVSMLEAIGVGSVVFDPCGNRPEDGDWLDTMRGNVENLQTIGVDVLSEKRT